MGDCGSVFDQPAEFRKDDVATLGMRLFREFSAGDDADSTLSMEGTLLDVGANVGLASMLLADKVQHAVFFEPSAAYHCAALHYNSPRRVTERCWK